jgi:membrane protease YdiL (CAAX protease family)
VSDGAPPLIRPVRWYHLLTPLLASIALPVLVAIVIAGVFLLTGVPLRRAALAQNFYLLCTIQAASQIGMLGFSLWILSRVTDPALPARFAWPTRRALLLGLAAAIAAMAVFTLFEYLCDTFLHTHMGDDAARLPIAPRTWAQLPLGFLVIVILAPLSEEAYFRGLVLGWGQRHWARGGGIVLSSLLFGAVHLKWLTPGGLDGWLISAELAVMGVVMALVAMRTRTLWASCTMHALNNLCALALMFLSASPP